MGGLMHCHFKSCIFMAWKKYAQSKVAKTITRQKATVINTTQFSKELEALSVH